MVSFEEAAKMLDETADSLSPEIFERLNGGISLLPERRTDSYGFLIMGMYIVDQMGRHIELYHGSFCEAFPDISPENARAELSKTLKHELTHHIENLACDRSLEKWDEKHMAELLAGLYSEPLEADSVLFICWDNAGLSPIAEGLFRLASAKHHCDMICSSAAITGDVPACVNEKAVKAAATCGADISAHVPRQVTREMLQRFDAVLCMTLEQGDKLAELYPEFDAKIMCLGQKDIIPPLLGGQGGWFRAANKIVFEVDCLINELCGGNKEDAHQDP